MFTKEEIEMINLEAYEMTAKMKEMAPGEVVIDTATFAHIYLKKQNEKIYQEILSMKEELLCVMDIIAHEYDHEA